MIEKFESSGNNSENMPENKWNELEELGRQKSSPVSDTINKPVDIEKSSEEKQERISQARAKVKELFKRTASKNSTSIEAENVKDESLTQKQLSSTIKKLSKYDIAERPRIDRIKDNLYSDLMLFSEYEYKQISSQPNPLTKTVRLIADKLGIKTKRSEERREREAMHVALSEYYEEEAARRKATEEREKAEALERERRNAEYEAEKARIEKEALKRDMATARDVFDYYKRDRFKKQRIQEVVERDLNSHLLTVDDLEMEAISENPEIQKRIVPFEDTDILVYDLKGLPFSLLSTTIDYRSANKPGEIGTETFRRILDDPSIWAERRDEAEKASGFGTTNADARGNTISTSYWNSESNIESHVPGELIYGFENVRADSILSISNGDGGTKNMVGDSETSLWNTTATKMLEGPEGTKCYNEVLLRRYNENGIPKRPDYIITENGRISKAALRSAKFFDIPIVNIERSVYEEKAKKRGKELLTSISSADTYEEMDKKLAELLSMSEYKHQYPKLENIGRNSDKPIVPTNPEEKYCLEVSQTEQVKRLDFIKETLEKAIHDLESGVVKGLWSTPPGFDTFYINIIDIQNQLRHAIGSDIPYSRESTPGNCNSINIDFQLKGSPRHVKTHIYDGEKIYKAEKALANGEKDIENADSSFYNTLEPIVLRYFEAVRKNNNSS